MSKMIFKNYGGSYQLKIQNAEDLEKIQALDEALWAATSVPNDSLNCDPALTSYLDTDRNGRIRTDELKAAQAWLFRLLANRDRLSKGTGILRLEDIDANNPEGQQLKEAAKLILSNLNSSDSGQISLSQVRDIQSIMASAANNGDGIITPDTAKSEDLTQFINSVMAAVGSVDDASGKPGISQEQIDLFFTEAEAYLAWLGKGEIPKGEKTTEIMAWGSDTAEAYESLAGIQNKIDQYFAQCAMVRFDERAAAQMQLRRKELDEMDFADKSAIEERLKEAPLAAPNAKGILDLGGLTNPLYAEGLTQLREKVLKRALGGFTRQFTEEAWDRVKSIFEPYSEWLNGKQGGKVERLGPDTVRKYVSGIYRQRINELIAKDRAVASELNQIQNLERLILYQKWFMVLANNFVSFAHLYDPKIRSLIEIGTLVIDGRKMTFTMKIKDRHAHKIISKDSHMYLLYLEVTGRNEKDIKFEVVAAVTSGDAGRLRIGKRGVFFTRDGREWDAEVIDIVTNPISLWESVKAPFQQVADFAREQIDKFAKSRQAKLEQSLATPTSSGAARDLLLGGSVAIAALGSAFAYITKALSEVKLLHILGVIAGIAILILLPGIIGGFVKLRRRDMSVILEASGWAVNVRMRLTSYLGKLFTRDARLPEDTHKEKRDIAARFVAELRSDSYSPARTVVLLVIFLILIVLFFAAYPGFCPLF